MKPLASIVRFVLAAVLLAGLPACFSPTPRPLRGSGMDMFGPEAMRIHPLSRLVRSAPANATQLEARVEFTDQMGDVTKAVGALHFELRDIPPIPLGNNGQIVLSWDADLSTPDLNKKHWDPITRTYVFKIDTISSKALAPGAKLVLSATMNFPNNTRLSASLPLTAP